MNILFINSSPEKNQGIFDLMERFHKDGNRLFIWSNQSYWLKLFKDQAWPKQRIDQGLGISGLNLVQTILVVLLLPYYISYYFWKLYRYQRAYQVTHLICFRLPEKIFLALPAKFLGIKNIWLEFSTPDKKLINRAHLALYRFFSRWARIIVPTAFAAIQLKNFGFKHDRIQVIPPALKLNHFEHQENIFHSIAKKEYNQFNKKFFTVGTVAFLDHRQKIENIFLAVKSALSVIPNLQIIIVGDGPERQNLTWLAKKMELDTLVWFVGEQTHLRKWLESFDIFVAAIDVIRACDHISILKAMTAGIPVIGPNHLGLEEIILENKTGSLIEINNQEMLTRQIIKLEQNPGLAKQLGRNAAEVVDKYFTIDKIAKLWYEKMNA